MGLLRFFDYIYYRVYHIYKTKWKDSTPGAYATSLVTLLQIVLVAIIPIFLYSAIRATKVNLDIKIFVGIFLLFFLFNLYRYNKVTNYANLARKWNGEEDIKRRKRGVYVVLCIIVTLIISLALATILGEINRGEL